MNANEIRAAYAPDLRACFAREPSSLSDAQVIAWWTLHDRRQRASDQHTTFRDIDPATTLRI